MIDHPLNNFKNLFNFFITNWIASLHVSEFEENPLETPVLNLTVVSEITQKSVSTFILILECHNIFNFWNELFIRWVVGNNFSSTKCLKRGTIYRITQWLSYPHFKCYNALCFIFSCTLWFLVLSLRSTFHIYQYVRVKYATFAFQKKVNVRWNIHFSGFYEKLYKFF